MWNEIGQGISTAGQNIAGAGVAVSMLGGVLSELGLTELGEAFSKVGQFATVFGSALVALGPAVAFFGKTVSKTANNLIAKGWQTQLAWIWVIAIIVAIVALIALIAIVATSISNNSPEKKLEKAKDAAKAAEEQADKTAEAYAGITKAIDDLGSKYDALDDLVEGTEEWNKAVNDVNDSVLDLIDKYPELAGLVENEGGVLKLDLESDEVQNVIQKYEDAASMSKAAEYTAKARVTAAQQQVEFSNLKAVNEVSKDRGLENAAHGYVAGNLILGPIGGLIAGAVGGAIANANTHSDKELQKSTEDLATAFLENPTMSMSDMEDFLVKTGVAADEARIMAEEFSKDTDSLIAFG